MLMQNKIHTLLLLILTLWIAVGCADVVETKSQFSEVNDGDWVQFLLEDEETNRLNSPDTQGGIYPNEPVGTMRSRWVVNQTPSAITFRYINKQLKYPNNLFCGVSSQSLVIFFNLLKIGNFDGNNKVVNLIN